MSKLPLDLSKFKKVKTDDKTSTLQHKDGHKLIIAHGKLSQKLRQQLDKLPMAEGGEVPKADRGWTHQDKKDFEKGATSADLSVNDAAKNIKKAFGYAGGGVSGEAPAPLEVEPIEQAPLEVEAVDPNLPENRAPASAPQKASPQLPVQVAPQQPAKTLDQHKQETLQNLTNEDMAWHNDLVNGHIKPETYHDLFEKKSTLGKIGTLFGLMMSGAGSGLSGQPNAVLGMMNNEIQNDLEAQKQSKFNAQNFLRLNQQNARNQADIRSLNVDSDIKANALANMQMNRAAYHKMVLESQKYPLGSPQRDAAERTLAILAQAVQGDNYAIADRAASASAFSKMAFPSNPGQSSESQFQQTTNGMRMVGAESRAKDMEEKHFPGLSGQASIPLSGEDRSAINSGIEFDQKMHRFIDWTKEHSGSLNPEDINAGKALAAELQGAYRQATHGGVYKEGEQNFISKLIDQDPTKFFNNIRVVPQLEALASEHKSRMNQLVKSKGFPGYQGAGGGTQAPQYKTVNGVKYMRGPNGQAIPVK